MTPIRCLFGTDVKETVEISVLLFTRYQRLGVAYEILPDGRLETTGKSLKCQSLLRNQFAMGVTHVVSPDVVFEYIEVSHLKSLFHHAVDVFRTIGGGSDPGTDEATQQQGDDDGDDRTNQCKQGDR